MAKSKRAFGLVGLLLVFAVILFAGMVVFSSKSVLSGFQDVGECEMGLKPCDEGYFCQTNKCIPILPAARDTVTGYYS